MQLNVDLQILASSESKSYPDIDSSHSTPEKVAREKILDRIRVRLLRTEDEGMMMATTGIEPETRDDLPIGVGVFGRGWIALLAAVMVVMP